MSKRGISMRIATIGSLLLLSLLLGLSLAPPATAQQLSVKPGGSYTIYVPVHKSSSLRLMDGSWEVRVYFYDGTSCYNTGYWWQSGSDWIYSGWYTHRYLGDDWLSTPEDKTFTITANLVDNPREDEDIEHGMNNLTDSSYISVRARLIVQDIEAEFSPIGDAGSGYVTFKIGGLSYQYQYTEDQYGNITITSGDMEARIDQDFEGKYRLLVDQTVSVYVSDDASSTGVYSMPTAINVYLTSATQIEPSYELPLELKITISMFVVIAVIGVLVYKAFAGRSTAEELPPI